MADGADREWFEDDPPPVAVALEKCARAIRDLGNADAGTPMGGMEALGAVMRDGMADIAAALRSIADAINEHG